MVSFAQFGNDLFTGRRQIDFIGKRRRWYALTGILLALAAIGLFGRGLNLSLEFTGGSEIRVPGVTSMANYDSRASTAVHSATGSNENLIITKIGSNTVRIQSEKLGNQNSALTDKVAASLAQEFKVPAANVTTSYIGPSWGSQVTHKAIIALITFLALVSILLAVYFRTWKMSFAALVALLHDMFFTVGVYALTGIEVSPATMIGFLTILGYSIYDTVVVFDKVRENTNEAIASGRRSYEQAANYAVNQTLVRSINTSVVALLPIAALLVVGFTFVGPGTLLDLALALFIGIAVGTYSSIFIATPLLASLRAREPAMKDLDKRAHAYQSRQTALETDDEHTPGESISGVLEPARERAVAKASAERPRQREVHPWAKQDAP